MESALYWIWLQRLLGYGSRAIGDILEAGVTAQYIYEHDADGLRALWTLSEKHISILSNKDLSAAKATLDDCARLGYDIITPEDERYPARLRNIASPPAALYSEGTLPDIDNEVCIGVVGTRDATDYGFEMARELSARLTKAGAVIISGGARGIDTAAHIGAISVGGRTVTVLGCGIDFRYNMENRPLRDAIAEKGAVISEYPPGSAPLARHFPIRNRLISGLSLGVVVVEGSLRSGSVITADLANEQGRDVFAIPGRVGEVNAQCVNRLLHQGAKPLQCPLDILEEYAPIYPHKLRLSGTEEPLMQGRKEGETGTCLIRLDQPAQKAKSAPKREPVCVPVPEIAQMPLPADLSDNAKAVYAALGDIPKQADAIALETGSDIGTVLRSLTELEIYGLVKAHPGNRFSR